MKGISGVLLVIISAMSFGIMVIPLIPAEQALPYTHIEEATSPWI